jgi:hypothetical protein
MVPAAEINHIIQLVYWFGFYLYESDVFVKVNQTIESHINI